MSKSSSEINDEQNEEDNLENIDNTEEDVINNKNKTYYFSLMNISKYKKYTLSENNIHNCIRDKIIEKKNENKINKKSYSFRKSRSINDKIINIESIDDENINKEIIIEKINENKNDNDNINSDINNENENYEYNLEFDKNIYESQIPSEQIFLRQKKQIEIMKEKNNQYKFNNSLLNLNKSNTNCKENENKLQKRHKKNSSNILDEINSTLIENISNQKLQSIIKQRKSFKETCLYLSIDSPEFFEISYLPKNLKNKKSDEYVEEFLEEEDDTEIIPLINNNWETIKYFKRVNNNIEFSNIAIRTINEVNYSTNGVEINIELSLVANSEIWIFSRCFVNKDINDSGIFDTTSINNDSDVIFNKYTSLIKIIKEKNSSKCFITLGIFYEDESDGNKIKYETFLKRQLVDYSQFDSLSVNNSNSIYYYLENDLLDIKAIIMDLGNEVIDAKVFVNKNQRFNHIEGKFFLPTNKRSKLLFCGIGPSVQVKKLRINNIEKYDENENNEFNKKSCTCCNIY